MESYYHLCTDEGHPVIFFTRKEYEDAIGIIALCSKLFPSIRIITFELMDNHIHMLIKGNLVAIKEFFELFKKYLSRYFRENGTPRNLSRFNAEYLFVDTDDYLKCVVAYVNRNGSVCYHNVTVFGYEWGANRYFFNPESKIRYEFCRKPMTMAHRQQLMHSRKFDHVEGLYTVDGYVSPMSFCDIEKGEMIFQSARQYMYYIARNIEGSKEIAKRIGEKIYYDDYDLITVIQKISYDKFNTAPQVLTSLQKMEMAKTLYYEYNANLKQLSRLLKLDKSVIQSIIPSIK